MVSISTLIQSADNHFKSGQVELASACCKSILEIDISNFEALYLLGHIGLKKHDYALAVDNFKRALSVRPRDAKAWADCGFALFLLGEHTQAIEHMVRSFEIVPNYALANDLSTMFQEIACSLKPITFREARVLDRRISFNICLGNIPHEGFVKVTDLVTIIRRALQESGFATSITTGDVPVSETRICNIFIDKFYDPSQIERLKSIDAHYGLVLTEKLSIDGRWGEGLEGGPNSLEVFRQVATRARFVWCVLEESVEPCRRLIHENSHFLPFGWVSGADNDPREDPLYDFAFTGQLTPYRIDLITKLKNRGCQVCLPGHFVPEFLRNASLDAVRANLSLQKTRDHTVISVARICQSLSWGIPVILEHPNIRRGGIQDYCFTATPSEIVDYCISFSRSYPSSEASRLIHRFREEMPMAPKVAELVKASCVW